MLLYKFRLFKQDRLALHPAVPVVMLLRAQAPGSLLGEVCLSIRIFSASAKPALPAFCSVLSLSSFSFLPLPSQRPFVCWKQIRDTLNPIYFTFEKWSHVTQADLKLYVNGGRPSTSNPPAYASQILGLWVWATTPSLYSFLYARQALPTELQPQPSHYFINKLFIYKVFINILQNYCL